VPSRSGNGAEEADKFSPCKDVSSTFNKGQWYLRVTECEV